MTATRNARPTPFGLAAALLALAATACASPSMRAPDDARLLRIDVVDRHSGTALPQHRESHTAWIAGEDGQPYTLRLRNLGGERLLVVLSVDGVNVVSGETAAPSQTGYVLAPYATAEIEGWRKSMQEVAAFRFSSGGQSYAARTGRPFDLGVIGAAVFREARIEPQVAPMPSPPVAAQGRSRGKPGVEARRESSPAAESYADATAPAAASPLGTAHGERRWSPTSHAQFERASSMPDEIIGLRYDRFEALVARGVIPWRDGSRWSAREPRPFPPGFVPDP